MLNDPAVPEALISIGTWRLVRFFYTMARMWLATTTRLQGQRTPLCVIHRGAGTRQVKLKLSGMTKINPIQALARAVVY